ncbi:MAG: molybdopterin oxidoreductase [Bdellovibrionales bacterium]
MHKEVVFKEPSPFLFTNKYKGICAVLIFIGLIGFIFGLNINAERTWQAYLMGFFFFTSMSLMSLFFLAIQHLTSARWSVNIRRVFEALTAFIPYAFILMIGMFVGAEHLYKWLNPEIVAHDALLQHKAPYLNQTFFIIRTVIIFIGWFLFSKVIVGNSLKQDLTKDDSLITRTVPYSIGFLVFFALSYSVFSVDFLMSLEPHWFSTIFGVYMFGGSMQAFLSASILLILFLNKKGLFNGMVTNDHLHDLGKFLLGFTMFWAYIAYSQYMLIWYANMPEETMFFMHRSVGEWGMVSLVMMFIKFIIPFLLLLPRWAKRTPKYLGTICVVLIGTQFLDLFWLIYPNFDEHHAKFSILDISVLCGFMGIFLFSMFRFLSKNNLVPVGDPRVTESASHSVVY